MPLFLTFMLTASKVKNNENIRAGYAHIGLSSSMEIIDYDN
jgi:hypothetical protein